MKKISSYASSGIESLVRLAAQTADTPRPARRSAGGISRTVSYTEILMGRLGAFVRDRAKRGPGAGCGPGRQVNRITVADVFLDHPVITTYHRLVQSRFVRKFLQGQTFTQFKK